MKRLEQTRGFMDLIGGIVDYQAKRFDDAQLRWGLWTGQEDDVLGYFARALLANLGPNDQLQDNLYVQKQEANESQIELFRILSRIPLVSWPRELTARLHRTGSESPTTHVELGIGSGEHAAQLVRASAGRITRVVGVDCDPGSVERSAQTFRDSAIDYVGIAAPFDDLDWEQLRSLAGASCTVDAAFSLHHLSLLGKRRVLDGIRSLNPKLVTLIEPSSDHCCADLLTRFINAYSHFHAVGEFIETLQTSRKIRRGLLQFFGREIQDIMRDSPLRFERHEPWTFWYGELLRSNMIPIDLEATVSTMPLPNFRAEIAGPGVATLTRRSVPIVSVLAFGAAQAEQH